MGPALICLIAFGGISALLYFGLILHNTCYIIHVLAENSAILDNPSTLAGFELAVLETALHGTHKLMTFGELIKKSSELLNLCIKATHIFELSGLHTTPLPSVTSLHTKTPLPSVPSLHTTPLPSVTTPKLKYRDCHDMMHAGIGTSGRYFIYPDGGSTGLEVYCDMVTDGGGWIVFQRRQDGNVDFYQDWLTYEQGFGNLSGEFWLGNDQIHDLVSERKHMLRIDMADFVHQTGFATYSTFSVGSKFTKYKLQLSGYTGNRGDSMKEHNDMMFSTKDQDNDGTTAEQCAVRDHGGWWYNFCYHANLNGLYHQGVLVNHFVHNYNVWFTWGTNTYHNLKFTEMKMRPV